MENSYKISKSKKELKMSFAMKDLVLENHILSMSTCCDRKEQKLCSSWGKYIEKVLERFQMEKAMQVATPLAIHFMLSSKESPTGEVGKKKTGKVP